LFLYCSGIKTTFVHSLKEILPAGNNSNRVGVHYRLMKYIQSPEWARLSGVQYGLEQSRKAKISCLDRQMMASSFRSLLVQYIVTGCRVGLQWQDRQRALPLARQIHVQFARLQLQFCKCIL